MNANTNANTNDEYTFVTLTEYPMYSIDSEYPHQIISKRNGLPVREWNNGNGYIRIRLSGINELKHRIIAQQFIPNPGGLPCVDHKNHNRSDNHLNNLRWVSHSENNTNVTSKQGIEYEFVDELEANAIQINFMNGSEFEGYWLAGNEIIYFNGVCYRIVVKHAHGNQWIIRMRDVNGETRTVSKRQLDKAMSEEYGLEFNL